MPRDWFDTHAAAYARNVSRLVVGVTLDIGDNEQGIEEKTVTIEALRNVTVGIDCAGIFASINVRDTDGGEWSLYSDGTIADDDDRTVGRHELRTSPFVPTKPAGVL